MLYLFIRKIELPHYYASLKVQYFIQEKEIKQNKQPNNGQCCLFIVGVSTGFGHAMTFFKMKNKCQVVLKYKKTDRQCHVIMIVR